MWSHFHVSTSSKNLFPNKVTVAGAKWALERIIWGAIQSSRRMVMMKRGKKDGERMKKTRPVITEHREHIVPPWAVLWKEPYPIFMLTLFSNPTPSLCKAEAKTFSECLCTGKMNVRSKSGTPGSGHSCLTLYHSIVRESERWIFPSLYLQTPTSLVLHKQQQCTGFRWWAGTDYIVGVGQRSLLSNTLFWRHMGL